MSANTISLALELMISLLAKSSEIAALIRQAQSEGRDDLTSEEWTSILEANDTARQELAEAIGRAVLAKLNKGG